MSLSSRESYHTCNTLVEIAKKLNYKLSILPETIEETQNLLRRHSEYFDKSTFISLVDEQSIYASCHRQGLSGIDLERRATNLKIDLFDLGIFESAHGQADRAKFEPEYATFKRIRETDEGALKDTIALCYVKDKRKKKTINTFSDINCWFVSNTKTKLIYSGTYQEIIRAEDLLNILWLSNPTISNTREIMDSSLTRLVSTAMSKALPKNSTLQKLSGNIEKYLKKEKIRQTDVVSLARNLAEKTNKNFNEFNKIISSNSEEDKISFIKDTVQKQEKIEAIRKIKFETFIESSEKEKAKINSEYATLYEEKLQNSEKSKHDLNIKKDEEILKIKCENLEKEITRLEVIKIKINKKARINANLIYWLSHSLLIVFLALLFYNFEALDALKYSGILGVVYLIITPIVSKIKKDEIKWHKFYEWTFNFLLKRYSLSDNYSSIEHERVINELSSLKLGEDRYLTF